MRLEWDPAKDAQNVKKRGFSLAIVEQLDWETSVTTEDTREEYGEPRFVTTGWIDGDLYVVVHTPRGDGERIISVRRANKPERNWYATQS